MSVPNIFVQQQVYPGFSWKFRPCVGNIIRILNALVYPAGIDTLKQSLHRVSELKHLPPSFGKISNWTALDYMSFYNYLVGSVVCSGLLITKVEFRDMVVQFSNIVYYMHHRQVNSNPDFMRRLKESVKAFSELYLTFFGEEGCTWKFHVLQHIPLFVERYGPAYLWDSYNLESFLHVMGSMITSRRNQASQAVSMFLLRYHATVFSQIPLFCPEMKTFIKSLGFESSFFVSLGTFATEYGDMNSVDVRVFNKLLDFLKECGVVAEFRDFARIVRLRRRNQILTSSYFKHLGNVDDSYIQVNCTKFGQVLEIVKIGPSFFIVLDCYKKIKDLTTDSGITLVFPDNQVPVKRADELYVFELEGNTFLQKVVRTTLLLHNNTYEMFCSCPNDVFSSS